MARRQNQDDAFSAFFSGRGANWISPSTAEQLDSVAKEDAKTLTAEDLARQQIAAFESQGIQLTDDQRAKIYQAAYDGRPYNLKEGADFSNVVHNKVTTVPDEGPKFSLENTLKYVGASTRAQNAQQDVADATVTAEGRGLGGVVGRAAQSQADELAQPTGIPMMSPTGVNPLSPITGIADAANSVAKKTLETVAGLSKFADDLYDRASVVVGGVTNPYDMTRNPFHRVVEGMPLLPSHEEVVDRARETIAQRKPVAQEQGEIAKGLAPKLPSKVKFAADVASSIASTPEQILPTIGAVAGSLVSPGAGSAAGAAIASVPIAKRVYNDSYLDARDNLHATEDEADKYATIVSAIQMGTETLGGPAEASVLKLAETMGLKKLTKEAAKDWLLQKAKSRTGSIAAAGGRALGAAAIEGGENLAGTVGQDVLENNMDLSSPEGKAALHKRNAENTATRAERYLDSFEQGAAAGLALSGPISTVQAAMEQGQITADRRARTDALKSSIEDEFNQQRANVKTGKTAQPGTQGPAATPAAPKEKQRVRAVETVGGTVFEPVPSSEGAPAGVRGPAGETAATGVPTRERAGELKPFDVARKRVKEETGYTPTKSQFAAMRKLLKDNPNATADELHDAAKKKTITKADKSLTEKELDNLGNDLGLGMAEETKGKTAPPADFGLKAKALVRGLVNKTTQQSSDIQSLIHQRKLVVAPNATSIGRAGTVGGTANAAEYDPKTGKMYLYTDHIKNPANVASILPAALHESVHAGTRSDNKQRTGMYTTLLGKDGVSAAEGKIRVAAKNGNKIAQAAVRRAQADTAARQGDNQHEGEEVVAYFASEAAKARNGVLGTVAGVAKDIRTKARATVRDKLGVDLDFNLNDLDTAAQGVTGEVARSNVKAGKGDTLAMIAGRNATGFAAAKNKYQGKADNKTRFEIPDTTAEVVVPKAIEKGEGLPLNEILSHPELYKQYPHLAEDSVRVVFDAGDTGEAGYYDTTGDKNIHLHPDLAHMAEAIPDAPAYMFNRPDLTNKELLRRILLHEVQHAIQDTEDFVPGAAAAHFIRKTTKDKLKVAKRSEANYLRNFDLDRAIASLSPAAEATWNNELKASDIGDWSNTPTAKQDVSTDSVKRLFLNAKYHEDSTDPIIRKYGSHYAAIAEQVQEAQDDYNAERSKAYQLYLRDYGETEARNTEHRSRMSQEELDANPPESTMKDAEGAVNVEATLDTTPYVGGHRGFPRSESLGKAAGAAVKLPAKIRDYIKRKGIIARPDSDGIEFEAPEGYDFGSGSKYRVIDIYERMDAGEQVDDLLTALYISPSRSSSLGMAVEDYDDPDSTAFGRWFGKSKIKDKQGEPQVMYHGTPHTFDTFQPNYQGLIFVSPDKMFGEAFAGIDPITGEHRQPLPLFVRAENPWDYTNPEHVKSIFAPGTEAHDWLLKNYRRLYSNPDGTISDALDEIANGDWELLEQPSVIRALKDNGYDSMYVREMGNKNLAVFDPNQLKHAEENSGRYSRESDNIFGMSAEESDKAARIFPSWFTSIFRNDKGLGKDINALVEHAHSSSVGAVMAAENSLGRYEDALEKLARSTDMTPQELNDQIAEELDAVDRESDSYDENLARFVDIANKYGDAGQALIDLRNQIDNLTMEILRQRAKLGGKLTPAEVKRYTTLRNNMGRYSHRMYAAYQGRAGKTYAKKVWKAWEKAKKGKTLTDAEQQNYQLVADAVRELVDNSLSIPSNQGLKNSTTDHLRRLYGTWGVGNPSNLSKEDLITELAQMRDAVNGNTNRLNNMAEEIANELLGLTDATQPIARYFRGSKLNTGILKERSRIPEPLRALMGEITSPGIRLMATVGKQAEFIARNKMLLEIRKFVGSDLQPPEAVGKDIILNNKMKKLEGEGWGAIEGWYASPNMRAMLGDVIQQNATFEQAAAMASTKPDQLFNDTVVRGFRLWSKVASASKMMQIVGKLSMFPVNFIGAFRQLAINGNYNPLNAIKAWKTSADLIAYSLNPKISSDAARIVNQYGVTDSAFIGEMKNMNYRQVQQLVKEMANKKEATKLTDILRGAQKIGLSFRETYAMMDVWSKIANFYNQVDVLKEFYEKNGETKTDDEIYREAADNVNRTNITYKRAAPIIKVIERGGITQFGTYFYETFRSEIGNVVQAVNEIKKANEAETPEARNVMIRMAGKRLLGQGMAWAATGMIARALAQVAFGDDKDKEEKLRKLLPDYAQNQDYYPVGKDENGKPVLAQVSLFDPIGPVTDFLRQALNGEADPEKMLKQIGQLYVAPRIVPQLITAGFTTKDAIFGTGKTTPTKQPLIKQLFPSGYENILDATGVNPKKDKVLKAWLNVAETFLPGTLNSLRDTNKHPVVESDYSSFGAGAHSVSTAVWAALSNSGMYMYQLDPQRTAGRVGREYSDELKTNRKDIASFFSDRPNATADSVVKLVAKARQNEFEKWQQVRDAYQGMEALGMTPTEINTTMKEANVPARVIPSLRSGEFKSNVISKDSINGFMGNEMKGKSKEEKAEIEKKWDAIWQLLGQANKEQE